MKDQWGHEVVVNEVQRLRAELVELQEAAKWLLECEEMFEDRCVLYMNTWWEFELYKSITAARSAVDALIGGK